MNTPVVRRGVGDVDPTTPGLDKSTVMPRVSHSHLRRWLLATVGVVCVGLAALGAMLPGLPTTIFLIAASWASPAVVRGWRSA